MELQLPTRGLVRYKSASQRARVGTENWAAENLFCPVCDSPRLEAQPTGMASIDYLGPVCKAPFQLKSQSKTFGARILDSAYSQMKHAITENRTPNLYAIHYDLPRWRVLTVILIPHFAFYLSAIECRKPLARTTRRAGWIGCNILLSKIPADAKIPVVVNGEPLTNRSVRNAYRRLSPIENLTVESRGWTLDVLNVVRSLNKTSFVLADVYARADYLGQLHRNNSHVRDKIRQQLQVLRDMGLLKFLGGGAYRLV
jgi:type II restriction enzyme